ncbi:MAG: Rnf-Nqr domain containing protein [Steroidobacteraceae bacterium]
MSASPIRSPSGSVQLLALCPLLAVSDTVVNALGLGVAVMIIVPLVTALVAAVRNRLDDELSIATGLLVLAGSIACMELLLRAWFPDLRASLGVFVPLVLANAVIVGHLQMTRASRREALVMSFRTSGQIAVTLVLLGILRELVGRGSLLHDAGLMFGGWASALEANVFRVDMGFLLAMLPPGAFISLGLLIAARNWLAQRRS